MKRAPRGICSGPGAPLSSVTGWVLPGWKAEAELSFGKGMKQLKNRVLGSSESCWKLKAKLLSQVQELRPKESVPILDLPFKLRDLNKILNLFGSGLSPLSLEAHNWLLK